MLHYTGMVVQSKKQFVVGDKASQGDATGSTITGGIIDRQALARGFSHCQPFLMGQLASGSSTAGVKNAKLDIYLAHGDSSGGGDLAEIDTGLRVAQQKVYNTGELTTDYKTYRTDAVPIQHTGVAYSLKGVKRYIAPVGVVTRLGVSTATTGAADCLGVLGVVMLRADNEPPTKKSIMRDGACDPLYTTSTAT